MSKNTFFEKTPKEIVKFLNENVVGQQDAKEAVALALRARYRRMKLSEEFRDEVTPKNILMQGSTGIGKSYLLQRIAKKTDTPFIKVEATKYTEVGYFGKNVEDIIVDLLKSTINNVKNKYKKDLDQESEDAFKLYVQEALEGNSLSSNAQSIFDSNYANNFYENKQIVIEVPMKISPNVGVIGNIPNERITVLVKDGRKIFKDNFIENKIMNIDISSEAINLVENYGIVFIDEIDKICISEDSLRKDSPRQGVQRDLLPLIEGCTITTQYGNVNTDHILFIGAGAFATSKPSDLIPELQGRFPIRVKLKSLNYEDLYTILSKPKFSLINQNIELFKVENITVTFETSAIARIAKYAFELNNDVEDTGARRLSTVLETVLKDYSYNIDVYKDTTINITSEIVDAKLKHILEDNNKDSNILI